MEIQKMLVMSTGHLTSETIDAMTQGPPVWGPAFTREDGWVFRVVPTAEGGDSLEGTPTELAAAIRLARAEDCAWLLFDRSGPRIKVLPWPE